MNTEDKLSYEIQSAILDVFKEFRRICENNHLVYFAIGGTCIGAVRHKGFIPWDDDLDVAMPYPDYKKFIELGEIIFTNKDKNLILKIPVSKILDLHQKLVKDADHNTDYGEAVSNTGLSYLQIQKSNSIYNFDATTLEELGATLESVSKDEEGKEKITVLGTNYRVLPFQELYKEEKIKEIGGAKKKLKD